MIVSKFSRIIISIKAIIESNKQSMLSFAQTKKSALVKAAKSEMEP